MDGVETIWIMLLLNVNHYVYWEKNVLTGKKGGGPRFGNVFPRLTNRLAPGLHVVPVTDEVNEFL
eukprot:SAG22_NODE_17616_length_301_cov_4.297030_1_plen_64_part_10